MANIKITELNGIIEKANDDVLAIVDVSANETKKIAVEDLLDKNVELIAVSDIAPTECSYGDKYYNTEDNLIYTAIANDTWGEDGEEPIEGIFYVVFGEQSSYAYNGTTLVSVGGGTEDIIISDTQPTSEDWKLWIDKGEIGSQASEIVNEYSESTRIGYACDYVNNLKKVLWTNPDPTQNFEPQTITLNDNINNYTYYEVIYRVAKGGTSGSSSKVLISMGAYMYNITNFMSRRTTSIPNGTSMVVNDAYFNSSYGQGGSVNNELLIPVQVIGYK